MAEINPQMAQALEYMRGRSKLRAGQTPSGMEEVRRNANADFAYWNDNPPPLHRITDIPIEGAFGSRMVRHYQPHSSDVDSPAIIHFHGGGWIVGDLDLEDRFLRDLALSSGFDILSVDYVLAPEHQFPKPLNDCIAVCQSIHKSAADLGLNSSKLVLSGSSAGANLAIATALSLRDQDLQIFQSVMLYYGVFDASLDSDSHLEFADGKFSPGGPGMEFFLDRYLPDQTYRSDPLVSPVLADLKGLPPCYLCIAELDELRDDNLLLELRLIEAGVTTTSNFYPGVTHGFTIMCREVDAAKEAVDDAARYLTDSKTP
jgi:acetyl esterase